MPLLKKVETVAKEIYRASEVVADTKIRVQLIKFRKDRLIETRKVFANHDQVDEHISFIEKEISISDNQQRMIELKNWLNSF